MPLWAILLCLALLPFCRPLHRDVGHHELLREIRATIFKEPLPAVDAHVVLLGDSTGSRFAEAFKPYFSTRRVWRSATQCERNAILRIPQPAKLELPRPHEGPTHAGYQTLGCSDCSGCFTQIWDDDPQSSSASLDFITVEYARDVEVQSPLYRTTQENVAHLFLKPRYNTTRPVVVVAGVGLHDCKLGRHFEWMAKPTTPLEHSTVYFARNIPFFLGVLQTALPDATFIWLGISIHTNKGPQFDEQLAAIDDLAMTAAHKAGWHTLRFFNASKELKLLHTDAIHHSALYYMGQARILARFLQQIRGPTEAPEAAEAASAEAAEAASDEDNG